MILESLLGGLTGLLGRSVPLVVDHLDKKNDRAHELAMFEKQIEADRLRGEQKIEQTHLEGDIALAGKSIDALLESQKGQVAEAIAAGGWVTKASAAVRPLVTYILMALYSASKLAMLVVAYNTDGTAGALAAMQIVFGEADMVLLTGILAYWFMDRTIAKAKA